jgi:hypothetical protein
MRDACIDGKIVFILAQVDFEPAAALTEEELAQRREQAAQLSKATRTVGFTLDGEPAQVRLASSP